MIQRLWLWLWLWLCGYPRRIDNHTTEVAPGKYVMTGRFVESTEAPPGYYAVAWRNGIPYQFAPLPDGEKESDDLG
ncbi:MAG: hypothetical protein O7G84_00885 [Gammaproteobacteria bacterium]|nr:hypothetical protein [Gammaproteobacteria bacterium]